MENEKFSKSGKFVDSQGNLEKTGKVREFENKCLQKFIFSIQEGK